MIRRCVVLPRCEGTVREGQQVLESLLAGCGADRDQLFWSTLLLKEALSNARDYGLGAVRLNLAVSHGAVVMRLEYPTERFNPDPPPPAEDSEHGRGILIMRTCSDAFEYRFGAGRVLLRMRKLWP